MATTFVQLFQLHRLFKSKKCIKATNWLDCDVRARKILEQIVNGLVKYLWTNFQDNDIPIIQTLFDYAASIYANELASITLTRKAYLKHAQNEAGFWKQDDLVVYTFGYLNLTDLINCSLVNSIWMYAAFNPLCNVKNSFEYIQWPENMNHRGWQRFCKLNHLKLGWNYRQYFDAGQNPSTVPHLSSSVSLLKYIKILEITVRAEQLTPTINAIRSIQNQLQMVKLKQCESPLYGSKRDTSDMLYLPNAEYVSFEERYARESDYSSPIEFPMLISNKCQTLEIEHARLDKTWGAWYNNMIQLSKSGKNNYNDILNVNRLVLSRVYIDAAVLTQAAEIFWGVEYLSLKQITEDMLQLWLALKDVIKNNGTEVLIEPVASDDTMHKHSHRYISIRTFAQFVKKYGLKFKFYFDSIDHWGSNFKNNNYSLDDNSDSNDGNVLDSVKTLLENSCKNIEVLSLFVSNPKGCNMSWNSVFCSDKHQTKCFFEHLMFLELYLMDDPIPIESLMDIFDFIDSQIKFCKQKAIFTVQACIDIDRCSITTNESKVTSTGHNALRVCIKKMFGIIYKWISSKEMVNIQVNFNGKKTKSLKSINNGKCSVWDDNLIFSKYHDELFVAQFEDLERLNLWDDGNNQLQHPYARAIVPPLLSFELVQFNCEVRYEFIAKTADIDTEKEKSSIFAHSDEYWCSKVIKCLNS